ncbi:hypothetical protein SSS_10703 [Sarcoptes scabiei]|uniref:Uncharacterized protein n=1 Tax=Sarcoptes scabiei TaxID=52283 RepID=A0A834VBL5_SARSC|nr:hypothetical protein SSS_10703 [Sarcoptes scabiei]UXI14415.1 hypothetical protein NH340_JMT00358 [Sarcoptes scabiei]
MSSSGSSTASSSSSPPPIPSSSTEAALMDHQIELIETYRRQYEDKMREFIYREPHTPPTQFELRIKHNQLKNDHLDDYCARIEKLETKIETNQSDKSDGDRSMKKIDANIYKTLVNRLNDELERCFVMVANLNEKEYRICQTGFVIGWKENSKHLIATDDCSASNSNDDSRPLKSLTLNSIVNDRF